MSGRRHDKISHFVRTTNAKKSVAEGYLRDCGWNLEIAIDSYFADGNGGEQVEPLPKGFEEAVNKWFDEYADPDDEDTINEDGVLKFCEDANLDPQDITIVILAWFMEAGYMGVFTRSEFLTGMKRLRCDSMASLASKISELEASIASDDQFKKFYAFCFTFSKDPGQKSVGIEMASGMWELLLPPRFPVVGKHWLEFLKDQNPTKGVTKDTWNLLIDFLFKVQTGYDKYDENEAWPVLIDDFMAWVQDTNRTAS